MDIDLLKYHDEIKGKDLTCPTMICLLNWLPFDSFFFFIIVEEKLPKGSKEITSLFGVTGCHFPQVSSI